MRDLPPGTTTCDRLVSTGRFYAAVALLLGFFSNWFADGWGGEVEPLAFLWVVINIGMPILAVSIGLTLWRDAEAA